MSILVTGSAGFIGGSLASYFARTGTPVVAHASGSGRKIAAVPTAEPVSCEAMRRAMREASPTAIIHAAGSGTVGRVAAEPVDELPANLSSLLAILEYQRRHAPDSHLIILSSAALYGDAPAVPQREEDVRPPVSLYGLAKAQSEQLAEFYAREYGVRITAVRLFSVYGPKLRKQLLWDAMVKFTAGGPTEFFGTGNERRDWTHIDDVCSFMAKLVVQRGPVGFDVLNCAGGQVASTSEILSEMAGFLGAAVPRFNGQVRVGDPPSLLADCTRARTGLGWQPEVDWRDGVRGYARWYVDQQDPAAGTTT